MDLSQLRTRQYMFDPSQYGRIYVFVDFGNVRPWAKDFWPEENRYKISIEIDIAELAKLCDFVQPVRKYFYYGHYAKINDVPLNDQRNERYRKSIYRIDKARNCGFKVRTKKIKFVPHYNEKGEYLGKQPKCNFDVELTLDAIRQIDKYDTIVLFSGDSDFGNLLRYLKSKGKIIVVISTRDRMSTELEEAANKFIPAEKLKNLLAYRR